MTEADIQSAVVELLENAGKRGLIYFAIPNGGVHQRHVVQRVKNKRLGVMAGAPDMVLYYREQLYCLELKTEKGKLSDEQIAMLRRLVDQGAIVGVAYGLDSAIQWLKDKGLVRVSV